MTPILPPPPLSFSHSVEELLRRIECRPATTAFDQENIFRLRYAAYRREGALPPDAPRMFTDRFDNEPNAMTFGLYIDGRLSSALRLHIIDSITPEHPALHVFPDYLEPAIERGEILIDPTRFVVDAESSRRFPKLPYATVRVAWMACEWFAPDRLLATVRAEHQAFYKRLFGHRVVCPPRPYPTLTKPLSLMALDYKTEHDRVMRRYPFFASKPCERRALFGRWAKTTPAVVAHAISLVA